MRTAFFIDRGVFMIYGYARVSTDGQNLSVQIQTLKQAGAIRIYSEKYTGTTMVRPVFKEMICLMQPGDKLIVTKLDRFARNTKEALEVIQRLFDKNISVMILNLGTIDNTPTGRLVFTVFSAFAQFERDMIISRTQEGKQYARAHNPHFKEGRPNTYSEDNIRKAFRLREKNLSYRRIRRITGISETTLKRRFKQIES